MGLLSPSPLVSVNLNPHCTLMRPQHLFYFFDQDTPVLKRLSQYFWTIWNKGSHP